MEIRVAALNDIEPICQLYNEFFAYNASLQPVYYKAGKETGRYPKSIIASEDSDIFIAVDDGKIVGFIHIRETQTPPFDPIVQYKYAEIIDFIVTEAYRNKGVGSKLIGITKEWARTQKLNYIELFVLSNAEDEYRFYEHKDFVTVSHTMQCPL